MRALITGASRGLGRSIAREFFHHGASLALVARSGAALHEFAAELRRTGDGSRAGLATEAVGLATEAAGPATEAVGPATEAAGTGDGSVVVIPADLRDPQAPAAIVDQLRGHWDHLDVLVNNAATTGPIGPVWDNDWREWQETIQVNLLAPVALCRACIPWMRPGGAIVNLSGGGATSPRANFSAYGTAKAALARFTETLAIEAAALGIRVNAISPGVMNTEMTEAVLRAGPEKAGADYAKSLEVQRHGGESPEKAAALAYYLASEASEGITGRLISAVWDPWPALGDRAAELRGSDIYTLRRIVPEDRGKRWA